MTKLRLGVIGAGSWAVASHLPNFANRKDELEFVGVCRKGPALLEKIKNDFGFRMASEDYRDVIAAGMDICLVSSPHGLHYEHAKAALEAGAHVLCEKPFTLNPGEAWDLVSTADRRDRHLLIAYGWNYLPWVREAKRLMDEHGIGEIEQSALQMASVTRELLANLGDYPGAAAEAAPEQATWTDRRLAGGGYGQAQLTHALGLALWLTGLRGESAFALMKAELDAPVEHHDAVVIRYDNGSIGTMAGGSCHLGAGGNRGQLEFRAIGSEGQFAIDLERDFLWLWRSDGFEAGPELDQAFCYDCDGPPNALVDLALGKDVKNCSRGELGARTVEILDAVYRSAESGRLEQVRR